MPRPAARRLVLGSVRWLELTSPGPWREELAAVLDGIAASHEGEGDLRSEEHTSELQSRGHLVCRLLLEKKQCTRRAQQPLRTARRITHVSPSRRLDRAQ